MLKSMLSNLLFSSPFLLVMLAGAVVAAVRWKRHPRASMLTLAGVLVYLLGMSGQMLALPLFLNFMIEQQWVADITNTYRAAAFLLCLVQALGLALLLAAVFAGRRADPPLHNFVEGLNTR